LNAPQKWGLALLGLALFFTGTAAQERTLALPGGEAIAYSIVTAEAQSARHTATRILRFLSEGDIEAAALLSNAPRRRFEVLRDYRESVGDDEFKRVFGQYVSPQNRLIAEIAIGPRRLLIWDLEDAGHQLAGQYYVEVDGKFLLDDVPGAERSKLQRVLQAYRSGKLSPSERRD
jgi:hypothetical protein